MNAFHKHDVESDNLTIYRPKRPGEFRIMTGQDEAAAAETFSGHDMRGYQPLPDSDPESSKAKWMIGAALAVVLLGGGALSYASGMWESAPPSEDVASSSASAPDKPIAPVPQQASTEQSTAPTGVIAGEQASEAQVPQATAPKAPEAAAPRASKNTPARDTQPAPRQVSRPQNEVQAVPRDAVQTTPSATVPNTATPVTPADPATTAPTTDAPVMPSSDTPQELAPQSATPDAVQPADPATPPPQ